MLGLAGLARAMGSIGAGNYTSCHCCEYMVEDPYLFDDIDPDSGACLRGYALCEWCWEFLWEQNGVEGSPQHWWSVWHCRRVDARILLGYWFPRLPPDTLDIITAAAVARPELPMRPWPARQ